MTKFTVTGMSCSACALGIEKNLSKVQGIDAVNVSLMAQSMTVEYQSSVLSAEDICAMVAKLGYKAVPADQNMAHNESTSRAVDKVLVRLLVSGVLLLPLMYLCMGSMMGMPVPNNNISYAVQMALTIALLVINNKFFVSGARAVINRSANMDTLVALSSGAAFVYSVVATIVYYSGGNYSGHMFYESAGMVVTLVTLGKWLEDKSKRKTGQEIDKLSKIVPSNVTILIDGVEKVVATSQLKVADIILLRTGDYVAVDGTIVQGNAFVDKSAITGESMPVECAVGDGVVSGSMITSGAIQVQAVKVGSDTLFAKIIQSVLVAGSSKAPVQKFVDKVASIFVPVVSAIAVLTFVLWMILSNQLYQSFNYAISVLVISCPCALGLATPVAIMATTGKGASLGVLYKDAEAIQKAQHIDCVLLDKTATITQGKPSVVDTHYYIDQHMADAISYAIENNSTHPIAQCIKEHIGSSTMQCSNYQYVAGMGALAMVDNVEYRLGNYQLVQDVAIPAVQEALAHHQSMGHTVVFLSSNSAVLAVYAIADSIRADSHDAIAYLNNSGITTVMVTGDNNGTAQAMANQAGIASYVAEVLPSGKVDVVEQYKANGHYVAMVGDGINDSPAIKSADVGIAMGSGTEIAIDSADIVILGGSLRGVCDTISLSRRANRVIKGNLFWAFFYNVIAIPVAAGAMSTIGVTLTPTIAAICMCCSSLFVVLNALTITAFHSRVVVHATDNVSDNTDKAQLVQDNYATQVIHVNGMMCQHCVAHVTDALLAVEGVCEVSVELDSKAVTITMTDNVQQQVLHDAIVLAGYTIIH